MGLAALFPSIKPIHSGIFVMLTSFCKYTLNGTRVQVYFQLCVFYDRCTSMNQREIQCVVSGYRPSTEFLTSGLMQLLFKHVDC